MLRTTITTSVLLTLLTLQAGCTQRYAQFGYPLKLEQTQTLTPGQVLQDPMPHDGNYIRVTGVVTDVCRHSGCWLELADAENQPSLLVSFTYPPNKPRIPIMAIGHQATVEGTLDVTVVSESDRITDARDQGKSTDEIAQIKGPEYQLLLSSPAARIRGVKPGKPIADDSET